MTVIKLPVHSKPPMRRCSVSQQVQQRFKNHELRRKCVSLLYIALSFTYLCWRFTIINPDSLVLSVSYFAAECIGFLLGLTIIATSWNYHHREPLPAPRNLSVDVLVPTYKEPVELIRRTIMAAKEIDYPHRTLVLDDGKREEVKAVAKELGVLYFSREQNTHAKAGNLNFGLSHSKADFVMTFDADHIALPHALDITLGFFNDPSVAMVQTPQDYYNTDAFQYMNSRTGGLWHDQSFFYNIAQACRDSSNSTSCVGTGVVYRRSAIDKIGGIPTTTVTEDFHTSIKMHKAGMRVVYLNEPAAYGVAASDLGEYYKTRRRWAHGNLHAAKHENILFCKGLTLKQRFFYLSMELIYLEGWQQLLLFIIPVGALVLGLQPFTMSVFNILVVLCFPFFNYILLQEIGCGFSRIWTDEIFSMARWPIHILAVAGLMGKRLVWRSSSKNIKGRVDWSLMVPQLTVLLASMSALIFAAFKVRHNTDPGPLFRAIKAFVTGQNMETINIFATMPCGYTLDLVVIAGFWASYNAMRALVFVAKAIKDAKHSHMFFRFSIPLPVFIGSQVHRYGRVTKISETWIRFLSFGGDAGLVEGDKVPLQLFLPSGPLNISVLITDIEQVSSSEAAAIEGTIDWSSEEQRDILARSLYSVDWHREFLNRQEYFLTPIDLLISCLTLRWHGRSPYPAKAWRPILYNSDSTLLYGILAENKKIPHQASLITFTELHASTSYEGWCMADKAVEPVRFSVEAEQPVSSLVQKGLDKAVVRRYSVTLLPAAEALPLQGSKYVTLGTNI